MFEIIVPYFTGYTILQGAHSWGTSMWQGLKFLRLPFLSSHRLFIYSSHQGASFFQFFFFSIFFFFSKIKMNKLYHQLSIVLLPEVSSISLFVSSAFTSPLFYRVFKESFFSHFIFRHPSFIALHSEPSRPPTKPPLAWTLP